MAVKITDVAKNSIGQKNNISAGDTLISVNGKEINDILDYQFYTTATNLNLVLSDCCERKYNITLTKAEYDDLGLDFASFLMDEQHFCKNKCVFCFIDQMPKGMRKTLYFKDDDSRMSFLMGNYITLTNLRESDIERIIKMKISPINISVHTTNPELRRKMMLNPRSGEVLKYIPMMTDAGIHLNTQLVLCPDYNDKDELERSLKDLCKLCPNVQSIAVVPVGLTKYRNKLAKLRLFTKEEAADVIRIVNYYGDKMFKEHGQRICFASDEFYITAEQPLPPYEFYEDFPQLENGVGMVTLLVDEFEYGLSETEPIKLNKNKKISIATGRAAYPTIQNLADKVKNKVEGLDIQVFPIVNNFFGEKITVTGLITATDLHDQLKDKQLGEKLLISRSMLRHEGDLFLDDVHINTLSEQLACPVVPVENDGEKLLNEILN